MREHHRYPRYEGAACSINLSNRDKLRAAGAAVSVSNRPLVRPRAVSAIISAGVATIAERPAGSDRLPAQPSPRRAWRRHRGIGIGARHYAIVKKIRYISSGGALALRLAVIQQRQIGASSRLLFGEAKIEKLGAGGGSSELGGASRKRHASRARRQICRHWRNSR